MTTPETHLRLARCRLSEQAAAPVLCCCPGLFWPTGHRRGRRGWAPGWTGARGGTAEAIKEEAPGPLGQAASLYFTSRTEFFLLFQEGRRSLKSSPARPRTKTTSNISFSPLRTESACFGGTGTLPTCHCWSSFLSS